MAGTGLVPLCTEQTQWGTLPVMATEGGEEKNTHVQGQVSDNGITCASNSGRDCGLVHGVVLCHKVSSTMK